MTKDKKYIVGINRNGYPEKKNITYSHSGGVEYQMETDRFKVLDYLNFKLKRKINHKFHACFKNEFWHKSQLNHFFNSISIGRKPWVSTFEYEIPRHQRIHNKMWKNLENDACKRLIAMSQNAFNVQMFFMDQHKLTNQVEPKLVVLHPPQEIIPNNCNYDGILTISFIGNAFYHKGGMEFLKACDYLWNNDDTQFNVNIVSNFSRTNWLDRDISPQNEDEVKKLLAKNSNRIRLFKNVSSIEVRDILSNSHISVLPSLGETYGYAVLESQAAGCPVITTNSWAFPEINNNDIGWMLDLPTIIENGALKADLSSSDKLKKYRTDLNEALIAKISEAISSVDAIKRKGEKCQERIRKEHSPVNHRESLKEMYAKCLE